MRHLEKNLIVLFSIAQLAFSGELECRSKQNTNHQISITVNNVMSKGGDWETSFLAQQNTSHQLKKIDLNVTRSYSSYQGNNIYRIGGILKDVTQRSPFLFKHSSPNAAIVNHGRSLQKLDLKSLHGLGVTDRFLTDDEVFTVRIDEKEGESDREPAIGVTELNLEDQAVINHGYHYKSGTWMFYFDYLSQNGTKIKDKYLKKNIQIPVGKTIGVMRSKLGNLHLFIDGVDQGPAASNIPKKVYGVFELDGSASKGTIVDA